MFLSCGVLLPRLEVNLYVRAHKSTAPSGARGDVAIEWGVTSFGGSFLANEHFICTSKARRGQTAAEKMPPKKHSTQHPRLDEKRLEKPLDVMFMLLRLLCTTHPDDLRAQGCTIVGAYQLTRNLLNGDGKTVPKEKVAALYIQALVSFNECPHFDWGVTLRFASAYIFCGNWLQDLGRFRVGKLPVHFSEVI